MIPNTVPEQMADLYYRLAEVERRARNRKRKGVIAEVGTGENAGKYRAQLSEQNGKPFLTGWLLTRQLGAGGTKIDIMLTKGEQVDVVSESGDLTDAQIDFSTYSDENNRENNDTPFHIKINDTVIAASGDGVTIVSGNVTFTADAGHLN